MAGTECKPEVMVKLLSLNLFLRPPLIHTNESDHKDARLDYFTTHIIQQYDIICLQEVFSSYTLRQHKLIEVGLGNQFLYYARSPNPRLMSSHLIDCGLVIMSKYRIVESDFRPFRFSMLPDSLSYKGVLYAKILINKKFVHVFTSHLQSKHPTNDSGRYLAYRHVRRSQLIELRNFVDEKLDNKNEAVVIAGDLNVDGREELKPPAFPVFII